MSDKFRNKYRIPSARLQAWDYGANGLYFVTICTQNRECFFGDIADADTPDLGVSTTNLDVSTTPTMQLSEIGGIAQKYWMEIPRHFPFVKLDAFVVMPNHVHGIIIIDKPDDNNGVRTVETPNLGVSTVPESNKITAAASQKWKPQTLGVIINQYKRMVTIHARKINKSFAWQSRYYDHIIRNKISYQRIKNYIINNPANWAEDKFKVNGLFGRKET